MMNPFVKGAEPLNQALFLAVSKRDLYTCQKLIQQGACVDSRDANGNWPLMMAAAMGHHHVVDALLCAGAEPSVPTPNGWTALMFAEDWGQAAIADILKMACTSVEDTAASMVTTSLDATALVA
jgi:ankyrin repeat protein